MSMARGTSVTGKDGLRGVIDQGVDGAVNNPGQILVRLDSGQLIMVPAEALSLQEDGSYYLDLAPSELTSTSRASVDGSIVVPVIEEELSVQRRLVENQRLRVHKEVHEREAVVDEELLREEADIERVAINQMIDEPVGVRHEGDTMIFPLYEEVMVVEKRLMLREEVRITRRRVTTSEPRTITLRSEEATVERLAPRNDPT